MRLSIVPGSLSDPRPTSGVRLGRSQDEASWGKHVVKLILRLLLELRQRQKPQQEALALADRIGSRLGGDDEARARHHFTLTSRYEWMFWHAAWRLEKWPLS
jgi:hypothetical protein